MTDIKKYIYRGLSKYTHLSYAAILDSIDVYAEDYDLNKFVGYYHSRNSSLPLLKSEIDAFIVELRLYYQNINDHIAYKELGELYKKYGEKPNPR